MLIMISKLITEKLSPENLTENLVSITSSKPLTFVQSFTIRILVFRHKIPFMIQLHDKTFLKRHISYGKGLFSIPECELFKKNKNTNTNKNTNKQNKTNKQTKETPLGQI